jgi:hypothetical protein
MKSFRDLEIARLLGWYRIPLKTAPKVVTVDYLAFYQTGVFGEAGSCIQYIAPVRGHELTTRLELVRDEPDHPRAREEYYKLQLGPLERLAQPIPAEKWRRITFFYTTGDYLLRAAKLSDLIIQAEERQMVWQALRERASQGYAAEPEVELDPGMLALLLGIRELESGYVAN